MKQLKNIWRSKFLGKGLKRRIFDETVMFETIYNEETWNLTEHEFHYFNKEYIKTARGAMGAERRFNRLTRAAESNEQFL